MNKDYISSSEALYKIDEQYFRDSKYIYQELFALDIPYYHKEIEGLHFWCRIDNKSLFIEDWYGFLTPTIINFFKMYRDSEHVKYSKTFDYHYLTLRLNRKTGEVHFYDRVMIEDDELMDSTSELILPIESFDKVIKEYDKICEDK